MTLSELFFGRVEMPARAGEGLVERGVSEIRKAIELEEARKAEEARRAEERRREEAELRKVKGETADSNRTVRYKTQFTLDDLSPHVGGSAKKHPPNLNADVLSFSAQLLTFVRTRCDGRGVVAYKRAGVRRNVYSRIISDDAAGVGKRTVLQFCIGLQLCRDEADLLLKSAGYALSATIPEDIAFAYCIDHAIWNLKDINEILARCGLGTIDLPEE